MDKANNSNGDSGVGIVRDLRRLRRDGGASIAELREFVAKLRGKNPQEVLGELAQSRLLSCTVLSAVICTLLMAAFTAGPHYYSAYFGEKAKPVANTDKPADTNKPEAKPNSTPAATEKSESKEPAAAKSDSVSSSTNPPVSQADLEAAAKKLDVGDTKPADPKQNPREKDLDKLLDGLK